MADNIDVQPGERPGKQSVATDDIGGVHYPIYKLSIGSLGEQTPVDSDNPLPVEAVVSKLPDLTYATDTVTVLNEISRKLDILIEYEAMMHKVNLSEEL